MGMVFAGVDLTELAEGDYIAALGHVPPAEFVAAVHAYDEATSGGADCVPYPLGDVRHLWAITKERDEYGEWVISWDGVTSTTPGAFQVTVIYR